MTTIADVKKFIMEEALKLLLEQRGKYGGLQRETDKKVYRLNHKQLEPIFKEAEQRFGEPSLVDALNGLKEEGYLVPIPNGYRIPGTGGDYEINPTPPQQTDKRIDEFRSKQSSLAATKGGKP